MANTTLSRRHVKWVLLMTGLGLFVLVSEIDYYLLWGGAPEPFNATDVLNHVDNILDMLRSSRRDTCGYGSGKMLKNTSQTMCKPYLNVDILMRASKRPVVDLNKVIQGFRKLPQNKQPTQLNKLPFSTIPRSEKFMCPKALSSTTKYSKWFRERYQPDIKIFQDASDVNNNVIFHKLSKYKMPYGLKKTNRSKIAELLNNSNFTNAPLRRFPDRCLSCAVVGSGGIMNGSNAGREIDSHDYVFRVNKAITRGHAEDIGRKTSFYLFFPGSMFIQNVEDPNAVGVFAAFKSYDIDYATNLVKGVLPPPYTQKGNLTVDTSRIPNIKPERLKLIHPDFFRYVFVRYLQKKPTTGALAVFMAMHICDDVTIYGFGYDPRFSLYYYDTEFVKHTHESTRSHDIYQERKVWETLHNEGIIRLFKRDI